MARLPTVLDYGARPSLRSNRVDLPDESGLIIADSISKAAGTFAQIAGEKKRKDDRLNYSLAKNDLLQADIAAREEIRDREDFDKFDEAYTSTYQTRADEVLAKYNLSGSDRQLLTAESNLIRERGRAFTGEIARRKRIDWQQGKIMADLDSALEAIAVAESPQLQNDLMQAQLENITAAVDEGVYSDVQGQKLLQAFVKDAATSALDFMPPEDRVKELELSLAHRKARGPITPEDLEKGEGSGSIADYLHADIAQKMLEQAEVELEIDTTQGLAFEAMDAAWEAFPERTSISEREAFIRDYLADNPKARKEAMILESQKTGRKAAEEAARRHDTMMELLNEIERENGLTYNELDPAKLKQLTEGERRQLERASQSHHESDGFNDHTTWEAYEMWDAMTEADKAAADLNGAMPIDPENPDGDRVLWRNVVTRKRMETMSAQKRLARNRVESGKAPQEPGGLTDTQFLEQYLVATPYFDRKPTAGDSSEQKDRWARIALAWDAAIVAEGDDTNGKVSEQRRREILGEIMRHEVFVREWGRDKKLPFPALSAEQMQEAYIPLDQEVNIGGVPRTAFSTDIQIPDRYGGGTAKAYDWLVNMGKSIDENNEEPSQKDLEEAWFYLVTQGFDSAIARLKGIEGF